MGKQQGKWTTLMPLHKPRSEEEVYLEYSCLFGPKSGANRVLRLLKSLYGLRQAPRTFFEKLRRWIA
jgi:hypothetical protein